jgi:hypothetical protein
MDKITIVKNFVDEDECKYALETADYSFIKFKLERYIKYNINLKGYSIDTLLPFNLNTHTPDSSNPKWNTDTSSYISFLIQLNESYENGYFQFLLDGGDNYFQLHHGVGNMAVFFSNLKHRTSPVINGTKHTLTSSVSIIKNSNNQTLI